MPKFPSLGYNLDEKFMAIVDPASVTHPLPYDGQTPWGDTFRLWSGDVEDSLNSLETVVEDLGDDITVVEGDIATLQADVDALQAGAGSSTGAYVGVNNQTGTAYTVVATDDGKLVTLTNTAPVTVTLPQDSVTAIGIGHRVDLTGRGAGLVTFVAGSGATVVGTPSLVTRAQYSTVTAIKIAPNSWQLVGDLASAAVSTLATNYVKTTASIATATSESGTFTLGASQIHSALVIAADRACRVRFYATTAQRDADVSRVTGIAPTGDHGLLFEIDLLASDLSFTVDRPVLLFEQTSYGPVPVTITNTSGSTAAVQVTLTAKGV